MRNLLAIAVLAAAILAPSAAAEVRVGVDRDHVSTALGHSFGFGTTIANSGSTPTAPLVAHLNVLSLHTGVYVDPEDWSSHRTQYLGSLAAGTSVTVRWTVKAVNAGTFATYVSVVPELARGHVPATSPAVQVAVAERKTLNSGGILPLATGIPALLALIALGVRWQRRRR